MGKLFIIQKQNLIPDYAKVEYRVKEAVVFFKMLEEEKQLEFNQNIITFEGIDYSGKSIQAELLANHLMGQGKDVVMLKGSGTTGADQMLEWAKNNIKNEDLKAEVIEKLGVINQLQLDHHNLVDDGKREGFTPGLRKEIMDLAVKIQIAQFKLVNDLSARKELTIITDRGFESALLGLIEQFPGCYQQVVNQLLPQINNKVILGQNIFLSISAQEARKQADGNQTIERPGGIGQTNNVLEERVYGFLRFHQEASKDKPFFFKLVNGKGDRYQVHQQVLKVMGK